MTDGRDHSIKKISSMSHQERLERRDVKRVEVLKIARLMGWINVLAATQRLDVTRPAATRTLKGLVDDGLLYAHIIPGLPKRVWYSITERGMAEAYYVEGLPLPHKISSGRWKISPQNYVHEQDVLIFSIQAQKAGASVRLYEQPSPGGKKARAIADKFPDLLVEISSKTYGIEIEREVKSQRRYRDIVASHWLAIERGQYDSVLYLTPDQAIRDRLARMVKSVFESVRLGGRVRALTEAERQRFQFGTYNSGIIFIKKQGQSD